MSDEEIITMAVLVGFEWMPVFGQDSPYYTNYGTYRSPIDGHRRIHVDGRVSAARSYLAAVGIDVDTLKP
jgi:hypothetical protein